MLYCSDGSSGVETANKGVALVIQLAILTRYNSFFMIIFLVINRAKLLFLMLICEIRTSDSLWAAPASPSGGVDC